MRESSKLECPNSTVSRPRFFVLLHNSSNMAVNAVLCEENGVEMEFVKYNGQMFQVSALLDGLKVTGTRPQGFGAGLIRRTASFNIHSNSLKGFPYINGILGKDIWACGKPIKDITFSIWGIDLLYGSSDLTEGTCYGFFHIDSSSNWNEESATCTFSLLDATLSEDSVIGATTNGGVSAILAMNTSYTGKVIPRVYGAIPRVKMLRGYPDFLSDDTRKTDKNNKKVGSFKATLKGTVPYDYGTSDTTIALEYPSYDSSPLRQMITAGVTVIIVKMSDGECIKGTLVYNSGTNTVNLTSCTRVSPFYDGDVYTPLTIWENGYSPSLGETKKYERYLGYKPYTVKCYNSPVAGIGSNLGLLDPYLLDSNLYAKFTTHYLSTIGAGNQVSTDMVYSIRRPIAYGTMFTWPNIEFTLDTSDNSNGFTKGVKNKPADMLAETDNSDYLDLITFGSYGITKNPALAGVGSWTFDGFFWHFTATPYKRTTYVSGSPVVNTSYRTVLSVTDNTTPRSNGKFYFKDPTTGAGTGTAGVTEWLVISADIAFQFKYYLGNGYTKVDATTKVYANGENGLIALDPSHIVSISPSVSAYGETSLIEIILTGPPTTLDIGATDNELYIDTAYSADTYGNYWKNILFEILSESTLSPYLIKSNLNAAYFTGTSDNVLIGVLTSGETYSEILDRICFDLGAAIKWSSTGYIQAYYTYSNNLAVDSSYLKWVGNVIDSDLLYENSAGIGIGKCKTVAVDDTHSQIKNFVFAKYGSWMDPHYVDNENYDAIGPNEEYYEYRFKTIQDRNTAYDALDRMCSIGHASGIYTINKSLSIVGGIQQLYKYEPLDSALVNKYPSVTDDSSLTSTMTRDGNTIKYLSFDGLDQDFLAQGVILVDEVEYNLTIGEASITIRGMMGQNKCFPRGIKFGNPPSKMNVLDQKSTENTTANSTAQPVSQLMPMAGTGGGISGDGAACSVLGRASNSAGAIADIVAGSNNTVLKRAGDSLQFAKIVNADIADLAGASVVGRAANSTGVMDAITATSDGEVLQRSSSVLSFSSTLRLGNTSSGIGKFYLFTGSTQCIIVDPSIYAPTGGWASGKQLILREVDVIEAGAAKKAMILMSTGY